MDILKVLASHASGSITLDAQGAGYEGIFFSGWVDEALVP